MTTVSLTADRGPAARRAAAGLVAVVLVLAALVTGAVTAGPAGASTVEDAFVARLNAARADRGVPRLAVRDGLVRVARAQARRMADRTALFHNPHLATDVHNWRWLGENVGYGPDATSVHRAFMHSAPHRANILDRDYRQVGIGAVVRNGRVWVAEVFRTPLRTSAGPRWTRSARWTHTLRYGSTGTAVQRVQHRLGVRTTGWYGRSTKRAVTRFQRHLGWRGCGKVGPMTWRHLF